MDKVRVWNTVLESLKINLSTANFSTWFPKTFIVRLKTIDKNRQITEIGCPNPFVRNTIEDRYYSLIKEALDQTTDKKNNLVFLIKPSIAKPSEAEEIEMQKGTLFEEKKEQDKSQQTVEAIKKAGLRPDFNFDTFAVSFTNQMAHAAAMAVTKSLGKAYNPLFLYGGVGVGKTHLTQAIAQAALQHNPRAKVVYCTSEDFTNEIVNAIRRKTTEEFKKKYRSARLLLVDDIQFIAGKDRAQEEFFHTFNSITQVGGQIILTSDRRPDEISKLEDRLRSRFEGGLAIDIQPPDFELRTAILLIKAQQKKVQLPMDVAQLIAGNITSTRKLEGFLIRLITETKTKNEPITPELTSALLGQTGQNTIPHRLVRPKEVLRTVASFYNLKVSDLTGPRRLKPIVAPRQILMYLLRTELKVPLMEIGRLLGDRDHTTIMYGVEKITNNLSTSEKLRVEIVGIKQKLYG
ncbi:MAG TPA: chromosomal replication initiator protein DnaA [Nevskiaceae bacterium]|nr:chromosomal replication initiator protein DnaA [Nevskiaceae bacterium]